MAWKNESVLARTRDIIALEMYSLAHLGRLMTFVYFWDFSGESPHARREWICWSAFFGNR